jgi:serine/threonine protein kinase
MDFGMAVQTQTADVRLTQAGMQIGSPAYVSPEQVDGDLARVGVASDIYSLGVVMYEL